MKIAARLLLFSFTFIAINSQSINITDIDNFFANNSTIDAFTSLIEDEKTDINSFIERLDDNSTLQALSSIIEDDDTDIDLFAEKLDDMMDSNITNSPTESKCLGLVISLFGCLKRPKPLQCPSVKPPSLPSSPIWMPPVRPTKPPNFPTWRPPLPTVCINCGSNRPTRPPFTLPNYPPMRPPVYPTFPPMRPPALPTFPPMRPPALPTFPPMRPPALPTFPPMRPPALPTFPPMRPPALPTFPPMRPPVLPTLPPLRPPFQPPYQPPVRPPYQPPVRPPYQPPIRPPYQPPFLCNPNQPGNPCYINKPNPPVNGPSNQYVCTPSSPDWPMCIPPLPTRPIRPVRPVRPSRPWQWQPQPAYEPPSISQPIITSGPPAVFENVCMIGQLDIQITLQVMQDIVLQVLQSITCQTVTTCFPVCSIQSCRQCTDCQNRNGDKTEQNTSHETVIQDINKRDVARKGISHYVY
ncbi:uncharacterized protein LOC143909181 [Arctopsyche grandis]|uniref:uncharacterized protein LOC143909181 n=1 Tax=Arctopsyche grandis TaxID=121162 RepID=UPI00406D8316